MYYKKLSYDKLLGVAMLIACLGLFIGITVSGRQDNLIPAPVVVSMEIRSLITLEALDCPPWQMFLVWSDGSVERSVLNPFTDQWMEFKDISDPPFKIERR